MMPSQSPISEPVAVPATGKIGYVVKMYPRFSETFIVNEILALERQGMPIEIFSLRAPIDAHFHETLAEVKASVCFLDPHPVKSSDFWAALQAAHRAGLQVWPTLAAAADEEVRDVYQALLLALQVQRSGIHHLHAHFANVATTVARLAAQLCGISFSFTAHAKDIFHDSVDQERLRAWINEASYVIAISEFNYHHLVGLCPEGADRIHHIYNGIDLRKYPFLADQPRARRILAVGRLVEKKGFDVLIEACRILRDQGLEVPCRIIGVGALHEALQQQIASHGLTDLVTLVGARTHAGVIAEVSAAQVFAAPCVIGSDGNRDGLPTVLLEAMALGTPCIATDVTGIPELLQHEQTGLCVGQRDAAGLAQALRRLLDDPALAQGLAERARARIEARFAMESTSAQIGALHQRHALAAMTPALAVN